jgi:hypothetical protein
MWNWFNCYLSGRHEYGMWCEPGTIFLRCMHCGRRSSGWSLHPRTNAVIASPKKMAAPVPPPAARAAQVRPFDRPAAAR